jgi:uncharacterized protein (TIGR02145 family)
MKHHKMMKITVILCLGFCITLYQSVSACSAFGICKGRQIIVGKNLDWFCNYGFLVVNKRNVTKQAFLPASSSLLKWTSRYGSITFTQNGVGFTSGGMNEAGLVIEESWLGSSRYPVEKNRDLFTRVIKNWRENNFASNIKDEDVERIIRYPETMSYTVTDIDGNVYHTVTIGTQTWMIENLKTTRYRNGDMIGTTDPDTLDISGEIAPKYQWAYGGNDSLVAVYGRLYTWYAITDSRNVCPPGWHVPTNADWTLLIDYLGGKSKAFNKLRETGSVHWNNPNTDATNESGFTGLPGGSHWGTIFKDLGICGHYWSATERGDEYAWRLLLAPSFDDYSFLNSSGKKIGWSVRCIKD